MRASRFLLLASAFSAACRAWPAKAVGALRRVPARARLSRDRHHAVRLDLLGQGEVRGRLLAADRDHDDQAEQADADGADAAVHHVLRQRRAGRRCTGWGAAAAAFSAAMSSALRTGTYAAAVNVWSAVGTVTSTLELVLVEPVGQLGGHHDLAGQGVGLAREGRGQGGRVRGGEHGALAGGWRSR